MKRYLCLRIVMFLGSIVLVLGIQGESFATTFATSDLEGTWYGHTLVSGDVASDDQPGWSYGTITFDSSGTGIQGPVTDSEGIPYTGDPMAFSINSTGVVTIAPPAAASWHGQMNQGKDLIVATATAYPGSSTSVGKDGLFVLVKGGGTFATADLEGTWYTHDLSSGDNPQWTGWHYAIGNFDNAGNWVETACLDSDGNNVPGGGETFSVAANGIVTLVGAPSFHGIMSGGKNLIVATMDDGGGGYLLAVMVKGGGTFTTADLEGTDYSHFLLSGDSPQWIGWAYGTASVDSSGSSTMVSALDSDGDTSGRDVSWAISSSGVVTEADLASLHGIMNLNKDLVVGTMTDGGNGYGIMLIIKHAPAVVSSSGSGGGGGCFLSTSSP